MFMYSWEGLQRCYRFFMQQPPLQDFVCIFWNSLTAILETILLGNVQFLLSHISNPIIWEEAEKPATCFVWVKGVQPFWAYASLLCKAELVGLFCGTPLQMSWLRVILTNIKGYSDAFGENICETSQLSHVQ